MQVGFLSCPEIRVRAYGLECSLWPLTQAAQTVYRRGCFSDPEIKGLQAFTHSKNRDCQGD